ncbi:hypothetical protein [Nonomuraea sp. NPDC049028]|uniref:hypothetical protein n=1 Tax=Nonomuraea sp. NPDC049028 TaxID=3364348 RepID=UPI00371CC574
MLQYTSANTQQSDQEQKIVKLEKLLAELIDTETSAGLIAYNGMTALYESYIRTLD